MTAIGIIIGIVATSYVDEFMKKGMSEKDAKKQALRIIEALIS